MGTVRASSPRKGLYDPKAFITHAALLRQAFAHCAILLAAASRRSLGRVSVPMWLIILSNQLPVKGLVGHYPTNYLIGRKPLLKCPKALVFGPYPNTLCGISSNFSGLSPTQGQIAYVLLTRPPLGIKPKYYSPFDLHALGTPPAFILSQDQARHLRNFLPLSSC